MKSKRWDPPSLTMFHHDVPRVSEAMWPPQQAGSYLILAYPNIEQPPSEWIVSPPVSGEPPGWARTYDDGRDTDDNVMTSHDNVTTSHDTWHNDQTVSHNQPRLQFWSCWKHIGEMIRDLESSDFLLTWPLPWWHSRCLEHDSMGPRVLGSWRPPTWVTNGFVLGCEIQAKLIT